MYLPAHFEETDPATLYALMTACPLATWITQRDGEPVADHIPFLFDAHRGPHGTLVGHVARANPVWRFDGPSLVVFQGPQAYVSPSWYASKPVHGKVVPTWNYAVVHAHGRASAIEDRDALLQIVTRLTQVHEAPQHAPWAVSDAPAEFIEQLLGAIVGIEIPVDRLVGKWKMSQNRGRDDRLGVAAGLSQQPADGPRQVAALVRPQEKT